jgi:1,4-dihydroxy-2-naphthoyl-CoA hydrolase
VGVTGAAGGGGPGGASAAATAGVAGGLTAHLGVQWVAIGPEEVVLRLPVRPELHQPYGIVHGGVYCTLVETAASVGAALWFGDRGDVVGVANHTDFLRPVREGTLTAVASPIHRGRTQQLWLVEVSDEADRRIARGQVRLVNLPGGVVDTGGRAEGPGG